jgi:ABC-type transport system substrate-binding protein
VQGNQKWFSILQELVNQYNNKVHRMIKTTPKYASDNPDKIKKLTNENNYENDRRIKKKKNGFSIGNRVRIYKYQYTFTKGFVSKWTDEIFKISEILDTAPVTYRIKDLDGEEIEGRFYENELQKSEF